VFNSQHLLNRLATRTTTWSSIWVSCKLSQSPDMITLGTESDLAFVYKIWAIENIEELKSSAAKRREKIVEEGKWYHWVAREQWTNWIQVNIKIVFNTTVK
jgi:hypothetical protein